MKQELHNLHKYTKRIQMDPTDKARIRNLLLDTMDTIPNTTVPSPFFNQFSRTIVIGTSLVLVFLLSGIGVVFASENTLPGDILYPIKTNIVENVARTLQVKTPSQKVEFETKIMAKRLDEAETLVTKNHLATSTKLETEYTLKKQKQRLDEALTDLVISTGLTSDTATTSPAEDKPNVRKERDDKRPFIRTYRTQVTIDTVASSTTPQTSKDTDSTNTPETRHRSDQIEKSKDFEQINTEEETHKDQKDTEQAIQKVSELLDKHKNIKSAIDIDF